MNHYFSLLSLLLLFSSSVGFPTLGIASNPGKDIRHKGKVKQITWRIPEDGGTPRDLNKIKEIGPNEFHIRATFEESPLKHAVSRLDLICQNNSDQKVKIILHLDLSGDGQRTDYDNKPEAGMPHRNFIFIQPPGEPWQQVNGHTEGWAATISFDVPPAETKIGLSPWYTYNDYLSFINLLPQHPHLEKKMTGKSDHNREHWELTITDPSIKAENKKTILWHAREHAYETFSSFAMEGLIHYLLSDAASEIRQRFMFVLHPMVNVDGVAEGFEYRGGYDFPDPRGTATALLTYATIDRLQPDYVVAWHNWISPRDGNVVFYSDGENGKPISRAWIRFTQLFPSLRYYGHRWKGEGNPLRYNWVGRSLSLNNVHQYAMKKYSTRVWGWEMPWWNNETKDAYDAGVSFAQAFLTTIEEIQKGTVPESVEIPIFDLSKWNMHEFSAKGLTHVNNPFRDAMLVGEFVSPSGALKVIDGFYDGDNTWRLRFVPDEEGEWSYLLRGEGIEILQRGKINCIGTAGRGFIRIHPLNPTSFATDDGTPFFPMGDTNYGLHDDSPITPKLRSAYLKTRRSQNFNFVRMSVGHSHERAQIDSSYWAWGGTAQKPDLDQLNPVFFQSLDKLLVQMRKCRMNVELLLLNFYRLPFTDTKIWTPARERLWLHYLLSRYGAFDNIFMWTIANEYETHPDGKYRLDLPEDVDWVKATAQFIKRNDPYKHLVTVHPVISSDTSGKSPRDPLEHPWQIGGFYGNEDALDVLSQQTGKKGKGVTWNEKLNCWEGDDPTLVTSIQTDLRYGKPVLNTENGYEYNRGYPTGKRQVHHTDMVRRTSWRIVCAGGYFAAGFRGTLGHSDVWNRIDAPNHYSFDLKDEGAAAQLGFLYNFFNALPFWRLQPFAGLSGSDDAVALAERGKTYIAYLPHGGDITLDLSGTRQMESRWFNPRNGKFSRSTFITTGSDQSFKAPDKRDWVLLLTDPSLK